VIALAHVGGMPVEEILPALAGPSACVLVARTWLILRLRHRRELGDDR
jgi:hypothetical protein